ncbi:hypothetical protein R1sor_012759 [Riccia sorocarpa]|uniref:CCHC-type domain-containing protein n=1 Tax=Riccia sorocarpa TaxID=122646 RepID=A0ABD3I4R1_9MARC
MEGMNYMDGSDIEETIFNPGEMTVEEWEELNDHRWYRESLVFSPVLNAGGVNNVNQSILEIGNVLHEISEEKWTLEARLCMKLRRQQDASCTQRQKKRVGVKGGCGEKDRYDAAQMVRFTHADSDGDDLDEEDIEGDEEDCDDDPKKVDRQKGLEKAVAEVLPKNFHMHCAHHLKMNVIKHFGAAAGKAFLTLVYMDDQASYERRLVEMETRSSKGPDLMRYIRQIPMDRYVRFAIPLPRYGRTISNIVECINGALKPVRDYAPCHIIWQMWNYMLNLFYARREKARQSSEELTEFATKRMKEIVQNCGSFLAMSADENEALVQTDGGRKQWRLTKLPARKCTCCKTIPVILQTELPMLVACRALLAAIRNGRQRIVRIPNGGSARSAESEYSYPIEDDPAMNPAAVMTNVSQEDGGERGNPPVPQSSAPQGEQLSQAPPVARSKGRRCCGACKEPGHTRRTCPALRQYRRAEVEEGLDVAADG